MRSDHRRIPILLAVLAFAGPRLGAGAAAGAPPGDQPAASQPAAAAPLPADPAADVGEPWSEPDRPEPQVLTTAAAVRALTPEQAATNRPVRIRGVVTYASAFPPLLFVEDETGGVCVAGRRDPDMPRGQFRYGAVIQVEGMTARGGDVPYVAPAGAGPLRIEFVSPGRPPVPRLAALAQLETAALHGETVEIEGVVRSVRAERLTPTGAAATVVTLAQGNARAEAVLFGRVPDELDPQAWVGAAVRARGVFNASSPPRHEVAAMRLLLRTFRDVLVRVPATAGDALPVSAIRTLDGATAGATAGAAVAPATSARVRVRGVVTLAIPGRGMFVQDGTGGVWVDEPAPRERAEGEADPAPPARPGDAVDVVAFVGRRGWSPALADATWRVTGAAPPPDAPLVTPEQALAPEAAARLVRVDAMVLSVARPAEFTTLVLQSAGRVFLARIADHAADRSGALREGGWVRVTGVCVQTPLDDAWSAAPGTDGAGRSRPPSFHLLVPSADAVRVISAPGWWTPRRILVVCAVLAAAALAAFAWVAALRRRVARQTRTIRDHLARGALYEERVRIARELHDSLEQDLLGITLQLNATEKLLTQPERARQSLHLAAAMVRRSQAETHRAVWDLRDQRPGQDGLVGAVREAVAGLAAAPAGGDGASGAPVVEVKEVGERCELPPQVENHLLRVALEAVTNAVKHSGAARIEVELAYAPQRVDVKVRDDGRGFDAARLPPPSSGHFGLFGMRERAEKLGGRLTIDSRPGGGTEIRLVVPLGPDQYAKATPASAEAEAVAP